MLLHHDNNPRTGGSMVATACLVECRLQAGGIGANSDGGDALTGCGDERGSIEQALEASWPSWPSWLGLAEARRTVPSVDDGGGRILEKVYGYLLPVAVVVGGGEERRGARQAAGKGPVGVGGVTFSGRTLPGHFGVTGSDGIQTAGGEPAEALAGTQEPRRRWGFVGCTATARGAAAAVDDGRWTLRWTPGKHPALQKFLAAQTCAPTADDDWLSLAVTPPVSSPEVPQ
ncbi:hypothetical protein CCHR01_03717 [Colletotrichum chrysophilum]|uniref:Uncharacterized protein n=1 Tax=Colletotrichum chrysophilum TaxID=1836956 RepID=A0AAD9AS93_9PEZI|nr:hypothetical protein CCHR01_03717 [Colletotrichum chrysophilum]